jgi:hypothetical protein
VPAAGGSHSTAEGVAAVREMEYDRSNRRDRILAAWLYNFQKRLLLLEEVGRVTNGEIPGEVKRVAGLMEEISQRLNFHAGGEKLREFNLS